MTCIHIIIKCMLEKEINSQYRFLEGGCVSVSPLKRYKIIILFFFKHGSFVEVSVRPDTA